MCAFQLLPQFIAPIERWSAPAELLAPTPPPCSAPPARPKEVPQSAPNPAQAAAPQVSDPRLEQLKNLTGLVTASQLASDAHSFSLIEGGIARSSMTELSGPAGCGKTEVVLQLLAENPQTRVAWIESELSSYPRALPLHGVALHRVLFCQAGGDLVWSAQQVLRSGIFDFVIVIPPTALAPTELRRLQLATEQARSSTLLLSEKPTAAGAWTLKQQFQVVRGWNAARIYPLKSRRFA